MNYFRFVQKVAGNREYSVGGHEEFGKVDEEKCLLFFQIRMYYNATESNNRCCFLVVV